ncbi:MAG TPA: glycosyl hydrolase [Phycisphaerae bacterium]|nr:glycosyl hydrolase [Phycisphaerae bacterium]
MIGRSCVAWTFLIGVLTAGVAANADDLADGFLHPPDSAKPWAYWWWLDSYATKEGITRDLEEMKRQGIAGVLLFDAGEGKGSPVGPVFMSDAWRELFKHAIAEADRLGIVVGANICSGWNAGGTWVTPEHAAKTVVWSSVSVQGPASVSQVLPKPQTWEGDYYRDIAVFALPEGRRPADAPGLDHFDVKAARAFLNVPAEMLEREAAGAPDDRDCTANEVLNLTDRMDASGRLTWDAPAGKWTLLRIGYALLGAKTSCTSPGAQGLEIDFFSTDAFDMHWGHTGEKMIADAGPLAGKTLRYVHDDSYEVAGPNRLQQNWTPRFIEEFKSRRGYDPTPYLPVLTGKIIDSRDVSNRFLWDYRRTIADLFASGHYARMRELAHAKGLGTHPESGGPFWPCIDGLLNQSLNDIPMGEYWKRVPEAPDGKIFWRGDYHICDTVRQAASAAHIYGKPICQAEAWTSMGPNWEEDLFDLKDLGDEAFCAGLTRNVLCFYVHQADLKARPGYQWEAAGTHFDRNVTWWDLSHAWLTYLARCQYMLQQGRFVADLLYFYGEDAPNYVPAKTHMRPELPKGYDCDTCNADVLLNRLTVQDGRLVLPDGMSYRMLVLPERRRMTPRVLARIKELVEAGATVVGPKPKQSPSLAGYPECDAQVRRMADELWGNDDDPKGRKREVGKGRVIWGKQLWKLLAADQVPPDFEYRRQAEDTRLDFIHRRAGETDIYFVSNQLDRPDKAECFFRVSGKQPEIWDPVTGERWDAVNFENKNGRTQLLLEFAPRQSCFVVFRRPAAPPEERAADGRNFPTYRPAGELSGPWTVRFDPELGGPESVVFDKLVDWTQRPEPGIKYYSGKAVYEKTFDLPQDLQKPGKRVFLDLGRFENVAGVRLNDKDVGVVWTAPWHIEITSAVQTTGNKLEITIANLWPNRLIGDASLPPEKRITVTNVKKFKADMPLLPSGLLGPVVLKSAESNVE